MQGEQQQYKKKREGRKEGRKNAARRTRRHKETRQPEDDSTKLSLSLSLSSRKEKKKWESHTGNMASRSQVKTSGKILSGSTCGPLPYCLVSASDRALPFAHDGICFRKAGYAYRAGGRWRLPRRCLRKETFAYLCCFYCCCCCISHLAL